MMTPERWQVIRDILEQALELSLEKRARFLDVACSSDSSLRAEVQSFLSAEENAPSRLLDSPLLRNSPLTAGTRLGDYEIVSEIGRGGMGVVYRARDLKLGRPVAIKVLRESLVTDEKRLRRFEQEAQSAAALNHPNILAVYQLGVYQGAPYLVSELLEGETLREKLRKGPLSTSRTLDLGEQIADGLSAAHQRAVIHRDLKPENLYVSKDGRAKILDFGLAKLLEEEESLESRLSQGLNTNHGMIAGTAGYTSPEQVRGEKLDARTDLFSLGVVLYEMATGERPFAGQTTGLIFDAILNRQPVPPSERNTRVSVEFERILLKTLEKDREVRYQSAAEIRADLKRLRRNNESGHVASHRTTSEAKTSAVVRRRRLKSSAIAALILMIGVAVWLGYPLAKSALSAVLAHSAKSLHAQIDPPPANLFRLTGDNAGAPVISPNGSYVAFAATGKDGKFTLWVRALDSVEARALPDTEGAYFPFWSPDSNSIGFFADGKLKSINVQIGSPVVLCDAPDGRGGTWSTNGEILFTPGATSPLLRVKATGGPADPVTKLDAAKHTTHRWPFFLPDGQHFIYFAANHEPSKSSGNMIYFASLDGRENRPLFHSDTNAIFIYGWLLFVTGDSLMARTFNPTKGEVRDEPILLARRAINDPVTWHADISASDTGTMVYGGTRGGSSQLVWLDSSTYAQSDVAVDGLSEVFLARLSPQGDRIVLQKDHEGREISIYDLRDKITSLSLPKLYNNDFPMWSGDGKWLAYGSARDGHFEILRIPSDGNGREEELLRDDTRIFPIDWNGNRLLFIRGNLGHEFECWTLSLDNHSKHKILDEVDDCKVSPDGQWLAYSARENVPNSTSPDPLRIYVMNLVTGEGKYQASEESGIGPQWSHDGKELYYLEQGNLAFVRMEVRIANGVPRFRVLSKSAPNLFEDPLFAVSPDKKRILVKRIPDSTVVVVTNFADALEKR
jgi:serine/threonine protein kinase